MKIFLIGFMGSGKTHWGKLLSAKLQLPFRDLDTLIVEKEQKSIADVFSEKGEEYFRYQEKQTLEELINEEESFVLSCGGGTPCFFNNIELMKKSGKVLWLNTSIDVLKQRLMKERMSRPLIRDVSEEELRRYIIRKLTERKMYYEQADAMVNEESITLEELIRSLLQNE
ncbi:shikimate kinase [Flavitalea sp. BT771]|uniref:shikimate kinase n=1 Tax=Flavitalea sp. BT771 TaxID=3063329 RepID=UPI0026E3A01E|nr:shikimate kinase [Flavitalea sp. BT771]MDO6429885.1 shikimate kinase [Flavitalea sp. BT771]MDV6217987.1 shikimate kinase [Flavitalea sp. BT771]